MRYFVGRCLKHNVNLFNQTQIDNHFYISVLQLVAQVRVSLLQCRSMQAESNSQQVDQLIINLKKTCPGWSWKDISQQISKRLGIYLSINDLISRYQSLMEKLPHEKLVLIFEQFGKWQTNFRKIAESTGIVIHRIKQEILSVLANNIMKVCYIVRKRRISSLKSNFLSNAKINSLLLRIFQANNFQKVKEEYSVFWKFVSRYQPEINSLSISDQQYKSVYRQLIILAQAFKISPTQEENAQSQIFDSFERKILEAKTVSGHEKLQEILEMNRMRNRKNQKEMINLVSDEEKSGDQEEKNPFEATQMKDESDEKYRYDVSKEEYQQRILRESIKAHYQLNFIEAKMEEEPLNMQLKQKRLISIIELGCLQWLSMKIDCE